MVLTVVIGVICIIIRIWWFALILIAILFSLLFYVAYRLFNFADKNPLVAILEGSELVRLEETRQGKKFEDNLPASPPTIDHEPPSLHEKEILEPDLPPEVPRLDLPSDTNP
jgi:hypothetical protein